MTSEHVLTIGMDPWVAWHDGAFWITYQPYGSTDLVLYELPPGDGPRLIDRIALGEGAKAFPALLSLDGLLWLAYRKGGPADADHCTVIRYRVRAQSPSAVYFTTPPVGGNWPQVFGADGHLYFARQAERSVWRVYLSSWGTPIVLQEARPPGWCPPTGLWAVDAEHRITTADEAFLAVPGMARARVVGGYAAGQRRDGPGVLLRDLGSGREATLWPSSECAPPMLAVSPAGLICVVTNTPHGSPDAVRAMLLTADALGEPAPPPTPPPVPPVDEPRPVTQRVDVLPYLIGDPSDWPRRQADGHQMYCHVERYADDSGRAYFVKSSGRVWEAWGWDREWVYHLRDHVDDDAPRPDGRPGRGQCYEFSDGRWLPRYALPGDVIEAPGNRIRWYRQGQWTDWQPYPYRMVVEELTASDAGRGLLRFVYDPGGVADTYERYWAPLNRGWDEWAEFDQRTDAVNQRGHWPSVGGFLVRPQGLLLEAGRVAAPLQPPGVTIETWTREVQSGRPWLVNFRDRNNPELGYWHSVELVPAGEGRWSVHVETRNAAGADRSGLSRPVVLAGAAPEPQPEPEPVGPLFPYLTEFLAWPDGYGFLYPGWTREKQGRYRAFLRSIGGNAIVAPVWADYAGQEGEFDYHANPEGHAALVAEAWRDGMRACVPLFGDLVELTGWGELSEAQAHAWLRDWIPRYLAALATHGLTAKDVLWCTGLEFCQINAHLPKVDPDREPDRVGYWQWNGTAHLRIGATIRDLIGPDAELASHWPPHRITGYPHYTDHDNPPGKDERSWWVDGAGIFTGLLHQRPPDEPVEYVVAHTIGGTSQDGTHDVGDAVRIVDWYSGGRLRFVAFEYGRELGRNREVWSRLKGSPLISGSGNIGA